MPRFWIDNTATAVLLREGELDRGLTTYRVESGIGASGFPHIGSVGDSIRAYGVKLGLEALGERSELIAYSDDRDGLRKVPRGVPLEFEEFLGTPVTDVPDPWGCHQSYGEHMNRLLIDALEKLGLQFEFVSGTETYRSGILDGQIDILLKNHKRVDEIVREETGSSRPLGWIHYWPVCDKCGRIYTTRVVKVVPHEQKVVYICDQEFKGINGCGHTGEAKYTRGTGKLAWKGEFAARWAALKISFEPHGKDITDSFRVNQRICRELLAFEPPLTIMYEMFLDKTGSKISKSAGGVITPQQWLRYAPPETLRLLNYKRYQGTRAIALENIPSYISELEDKLSLYHDLESIRDERKRSNEERLLKYTYLLGEVPAPHEYRFNTIVSVIDLLPYRHMSKEELLEATSDVIGSYYDIPASELLGDSVFRELFALALNYVMEIRSKVGEERESIRDVVREAIAEFLQGLREGIGGEEIQDLAFSTIRRHGIPAGEFFSSIYLLLLGKSRGPKLGPLIERLGVDKAKSLISRALSRVEV